jgi:tight adherence protein C
MFDLLGSLDPKFMVGGLTIAFGMVVYAVLAQMEEKAALRSSLRQLDEYEVENVRDAELLAPMRERLLGPVAETIAKLGSRFNPPDYVEGIRKRHVQAGINSPDKVERFLAVRLIGFVFAPVWVIVMLFWNPLGVGGLLKWAMLGLGVMIAVMGPASSLNKKVEARQKAISRSLPDVMDLLVISVEAGLGFEQALDRVITNVPGELSDEFARVLGESRAGSNRSDALRAMEERCGSPEIRSFVLAMIQADTFGVSIGRVLRAQADELRVKRRQKAQEQAQKAPVKMMIPMVFCIFPALFVVVIGPAVINISQAF